MRALAFVLLALPASAGVVRAPVGPAALAIPALAAPAMDLSPMPVLPPYLSVADAGDRVLLAQIVQAAQVSPTATAVLARVERLSAERGRPLVVEILKMKESGTYNLDWGIISLRRKDLKEGPKANVSTIIHEMLHLLQTDLDVPSDLIETELEAYVVDFRVARELGVTPRPGSYDARAQAAFRKGVEPFMDFLAKNYPEDGTMWRTRSREYEARLRKGLAESEEESARLTAQRAKRVEVLEQMTSLGHPAHELRAYHEDAIKPLDAALETAHRAVAYAKADLAIFASPERLAAARAYARSVIRKARAFQKIFARP